MNNIIYLVIIRVVDVAVPNILNPSEGLGGGRIEAAAVACALLAFDIVEPGCRVVPKADGWGEVGPDREALETVEERFGEAADFAPCNDNLDIGGRSLAEVLRCGVAA